MTKGQNVKDMMTAMNPPRTFDDSFYLYVDAAKKKISLDEDVYKRQPPGYSKIVGKENIPRLLLFMPR